MTSTHPEHCIGVRLLIPVGGLHKIVEKILPDGNHIATQLLNKLLKAELALDGVEAKALLVGPHNQLAGIVLVDDLDKGLLVVERVFADYGITQNLIEIGWFDFQEGCWRLHPYGDATEFCKAFGPDCSTKLRKQIAHWTQQIKESIPQ